jgi:hypothetical protein
MNEPVAEILNKYCWVTRWTERWLIRAQIDSKGPFSINDPNKITSIKGAATWHLYGRSRLKKSQFTLKSPSKFAVDDDGNLSQMHSTEIFKKNYWSAGCITAIDPHDWPVVVRAVCTKLIFLFEDEQVAGLPRSLAVCK